MRLRLSVVSFFILGLLSAQASAGLSPEKATELLARAQAINIKCTVLSEAEGQALSDMVARAEISLAEKASVKAARSALTKGRALGRATKCDEASTQTVKDVLSAAQRATALSDLAAVNVPEVIVAEPDKKVVPAPTIEKQDEQKTSAQDAEEPMVETPAVKKPDALKIVKPPKLVKAETSDKAEPKKVAKAKPEIKKPETKFASKKATVEKSVEQKVLVRASGYAVLAENYYRELRCRRMSYAQVNAMYQNVLRQHRAAVNTHGRNAVRKLLANARARAASRSC